MKEEPEAPGLRWPGELAISGGSACLACCEVSSQQRAANRPSWVAAYLDSHLPTQPHVQAQPVINCSGVLETRTLGEPVR